MWTCPKCGREFKKKNQSHYCGEAPKTVSEYIESQPHLKQIVNIIHKTIPNVNERIVWSMPTYEKDKKSISFSTCKNHVSLYVGAEAIENFESGLNEFTTKKSAIYLPYNKDLPVKLIKDIVKRCLS